MLNVEMMVNQARITNESEMAAPECGSPGGRIEIVARNGRRVIVDADVDVTALIRVLGALEQA